MKLAKLKSIVAYYATTNDVGVVNVKIVDDTFEAACINNNNISELIAALDFRYADKTDCENWHLTPMEWRAAIGRALAWKIVTECNNEMPSDEYLANLLK